MAVVLHLAAPNRTLHVLAHVAILATEGCSSRKSILTGFDEEHNGGSICMQNGLVFQILWDVVNEDNKQEGGLMWCPEVPQALILFTPDSLLFRTTFSDLSLRQSVRQAWRVPENPSAESFSTRPGCYTRSKALLMSRQATRASSLLLSELT